MDKSETPCRFKFCENPSCKFWHPPVRLNYKSEKGCVRGDKCHFRHVEAEGKPHRRSKKGGAKGSVATLKESLQLGCVSQDSYPRKSILREPGRSGSKHADMFSKRTWHQIKIRERKGASRGIIQKCARHERSPCAPKSNRGTGGVLYCSNRASIRSHALIFLSQTRWIIMIGWCTSLSLQPFVQTRFWLWFLVVYKHQSPALCFKHVWIVVPCLRTSISLQPFSQRSFYKSIPIQTKNHSCEWEEMECHSCTFTRWRILDSCSIQDGYKNASSLWPRWKTNGWFKALGYN